MLMNENKENRLQFELDDEVLGKVAGGTTMGVRCRHCGAVSDSFKGRVEKVGDIFMMISVCPKCGKDM